MKNELVTKLMIYSAALIPRTCSYLTKDKGEDEKVKGTTKCVIKRKHYLQATQFENKINQLEKNKVGVDSLHKKS